VNALQEDCGKGSVSFRTLRKLRLEFTKFASGPILAVLGTERRQHLKRCSKNAWIAARLSHLRRKNDEKDRKRNTTCDFVKLQLYR
jgi:hypothetical protein